MFIQIQICFLYGFSGSFRRLLKPPDNLQRARVTLLYNFLFSYPRYIISDNLRMSNVSDVTFSKFSFIQILKYLPGIFR